MSKPNRIDWWQLALLIVVYLVGVVSGHVAAMGYCTDDPALMTCAHCKAAMGAR